MGSDIHIAAEIFCKKTGKFHFLHDYGDKEFIEWEHNPSDRNYELFGTLAGVRRAGQICEPRGIPSDASALMLEYLDSYSSDGHSHSYFTLHELFTEPKMEQHKPTAFYRWIQFLGSVGISHQDIRICFFFDN